MAASSGASDSSAEPEMLEMGIDPDIFVIDKQFLEDLQCYICRLVLRDPVSCPKGCLFCRSCIQKWLTMKDTCPGERDPLTMDQTNREKHLKSIIEKCKVKCPNGSGDSKCDWSQSYVNYEIHHKCCPYKEVSCQSCGQKTMRKDLEDHRAECPKETVCCESCETRMEQGQLTKHISFLCGEKRTHCPLQCGKRVLRKDVMEHVLTSCAAYVEKCPIPGCGKTVNSQTKHNKDDGNKHANLLLVTEGAQGSSRTIKGTVHGFRWIVPDATLATRSRPFQTGQLKWSLLVLPSDRHARQHLGVFIKLVDGEPTLTNIRLKLTYGGFTRQLEGKLHFSAGKIMGWPKALQVEQMDSQRSADRLSIDISLQHYLQ